jgi:SAM-dependent methyltransferase
VNYFAHSSAAERYAASRPYFHPIVIARIREFLALGEPVPHAVDVACGTGQSALALTEIANQVTALDVSPSMLAHAPAHPQIRYVEAAAEQIPLDEGAADLMTVSLAFHWLDRGRFLAEAHRVVRPGGHLVIYGNEFHGRMSENPDFAHWYGDEYFDHFPTPPRDTRPFTDQDAEQLGFRFVGRETYTNDLTLTAFGLVRYLMTHSNVISVVEGQHLPADTVFARLVKAVHPFFREAEGTFRFGGDIWYLANC